MAVRSALALSAVLSAAAVPALAQPSRWEAPGALVSVSVEVDGRKAPLFAAPDGSGRYYLQARPGAGYSVRVANRTSDRLGVLLAVDGLNVVSGEREPGPDLAPGTRPGRMYVLGPGDDVVVQGWRTSLAEVRRFTFVDEHASYAARSGKANAKMGWIEAWVYRECAPRRGFWDRITGEPRTREEGKDEEAPPATAPGAAKAEGAPTQAPETLGRTADAAGAAPRSYPGTGWGERTRDQATVVRFLPEARPADRVTLRYEYAPALRALGVLPPAPARDRLRERDRGDGFARPPAW